MDSNKSDISINSSFIDFSFSDTSKIESDHNLTAEGMYFNFEVELQKNYYFTYLLNIMICFSDKNTRRAVSFYSDTNISVRNLTRTAQLLNESLGSSFHVPTSHKKLLKSVDPCYQFELHIKCTTCKIYTSTESPNHKTVLCAKCQKVLRKEKMNYFVYIPFEQQIRSMIQKNLNQIIEYNKKFANESSIIIDVQSSNVHKKIAAKHPNSVILSLVLNTDGANVYNSTNKSVWPIQLYQNYLPPSVRYIPENILVIGLSFGIGKPDVKQLILPFAKECRQIFTNNGLKFMHSDQDIIFLPMVTHVCCDIPARAMVQEMVAFNGYDACCYCDHPGVIVKSESGKKSKVVRYVNRQNLKPRAHANVSEIMLRLSQRNDPDPICGIKSVSCMAGFKYFDMVDGYCVDYMHCALLGLVKMLLKFWLDPPYFKKPFHINEENANILDARLLSIRPTSEISRKPRSLRDRKHYKANEYRSLLLYYLRFCLSGILNMNYVHHFQLLSAAIYILLKEKVTHDEIAKAEEMLIEFADEFETLYGIDSTTMNIHLLRHIPNAVRNLGPLWAQSAFGFEANNGVLLKSANGNNNVSEEITKKYILRRTLLQTQYSQRNLDCEPLNFTGNKIVIELTLSEQRDFETHGIAVVDSRIGAWTRMKFNGRIYTSLKYIKTKSIDYFVVFSDETFGVIHFFFKYNNIGYVYYEKFKTCSETDHLIEVQSTSSFLIEEIENITEKLIFMEINNRKYVTRIPNHYEKT